MSPFHIAIDGPVSAGKGTVSRLVAEKLGLLYVDTGAMYRMTALLAKNHQVELENEPAVVALVKAAKMEMRNPNDQERDGRLTTVILDGEDVSWKIRTEEISAGSSKVAALPEVRKVLVKKQQEIAKGQNVIVEGRDITYRVLPHAQLKIYLTANDMVRAERRHLQLQMRGVDVTFEEIFQDTLERDKRDMSRSADPLQITPDAWIVDTTDVEINKVVEMIVAKVNVLRANQNMANFFSREKDLETKLDGLSNKDFGTKKLTADSPEEKTNKPARKSKIQAEAELRQGRWVAPIILVVTMAISGILWLIKNFSQP